jgi:phosphoserine phosphatase RsbU/P
MRILIAEDDVTSRTVLRAALTKQGHDVMATVDGAEAWQAMQQPDAPRLAILDWMMPHLEGLEVCRRIRALQTDQPPYIIMLTGRGEKDDIIAGLEAGADDYLSKPFDAGELRARVNVGRRVVDAQAALAGSIAELRDALDHIRTLQGILPICSFCKNIRDDQGYWRRVDAYISTHAGVRFSHSVCPDCMKTHYPDAV